MPLYYRTPLAVIMEAVLFLRLYTAVASELLSPPLTPHVCHLVLPRLQALSLPVLSLLHSLEAGSVEPSPELLYGLLQLVHTRLGEQYHQR